MNKNCGIYQIRNILNNKCYYGSSKDIKDRLYNHKLLLKNNNHYNLKLQNIWNKCGEENFAFEKIVICEEKDLLFYEQLFIDYNFEHNDGGYNLARDAKAFFKGRNHSEKSKEKIRNSQKGKQYTLGKKLSEEHKQKISNSLNGRKHSEETIQKMKKSQKGRIISEEHKQKISKTLKDKNVLRKRFKGRFIKDEYN